MNAHADNGRGGSLKTWFFNPFHNIAGGKALGIGLVVIVVAAVNGSVSNTHFDGVFDAHTGLQAPVSLHIFEGLVNWLALSVCLCLAGLALRGRRFRAIDVFGTQALARFPTLFIAFAVLLPGYQRQALRLAAMNNEIVAADIAAFARRAWSYSPPSSG
ncbi:MAG: hypothetical protein H3C30_12270 [Candidatus Hydrogenedentes bacterium]|nr:hypothetical protein [Candidatus Hydrogenedentota bacterium]